MSKKLFFLLLVVGILLFLPFTVGKRENGMMKNSQSATDSSMAMPTGQSAMIAPAPDLDGKFIPTTDRTIVKQANLNLLVNDTRKFVDQATQVVKELGGVITSANIYENTSDTSAINADITLRVPVDKLEATVNQLKSLSAKVTAENITSEDKTEQKVDLEAQIINLQASEQQLLNIMKEARTVEDTLKVQNQLTQTRDRIERLQASLENLQGAASMSTIRVFASTKESSLSIIKPTANSLSDEIKMALRDTVTFYRQIIIALIRITVIVSPVFIVGLIVWLIARRFMP